MQCHILHVRQNSEEWDEVRRGRITASRLGDVMAKPTTKRYQDYRMELALGRLGVPLEDTAKPWYEHGKDMEPRAIAAYEWKYETEVAHDLFLVHHRFEWLGCSPDILTTDYAEGGEIKCRKLYKSYVDARDSAERAMRAGKTPAPAEYRHQIQGAMLVTGKESWLYVNYWESERDGSRKLSRHIVKRDDSLIAEMVLRCVRLNREVEALMEQL